VVHTFIASQLLTTGLKSEILEYFNDFDKNNNGVIEIEELR
jgi:Ca2+-binding EF-hand superfamily protein